MTDHDQFVLDHISSYYEECPECLGKECENCDWTGEIKSK